MQINFCVRRLFLFLIHKLEAPNGDEASDTNMGQDITVEQTVNGTTYTIHPASKMAVKAVGDWELDVLAIPFGSVDSDGQWFDASTDIMHEAFTTPLIVYQHGVAQGARSIQDRPQVIGKAKPGSLEKRGDGWHVRVILDKSIKAAKDIMDAAWKGLVAVSSGSIAHLARLDIGGKMIPYEKNRKGRIAVWGLAEVSLWEKGNGNAQPANQFAVAMPVMKAIYRDAGVPFPDLTNHNFTDGSLSEAEKATKDARKAEVIQKAKAYLEKTR